MTANQYSASVSRHQSSPADRRGDVDRSAHPGEAWSGSSENGDAPFFPPIMIALILAVFMLWVGLYTARATETANAAPAVPVVVQMKNVDAPGLLLRARRPGFYVLAPTIASDVDVTITTAVARTRVTQRFRNPSDGWIEGIYVFPLPEGAAVDTLKMIVGNRAIEGRIEERAAARAAFEEAKTNEHFVVRADEVKRPVVASEPAAPQIVHDPLRAPEVGDRQVLAVAQPQLKTTGTEQTAKH